MQQQRIGMRPCSLCLGKQMLVAWGLETTQPSSMSCAAKQRRATISSVRLRKCHEAAYGLGPSS